MQLEVIIKAITLFSGFYVIVFASYLQMSGSIAASVVIKLTKPNAAIRDANAALEVCW